MTHSTVSTPLRNDYDHDMKDILPELQTLWFEGESSDQALADITASQRRAYSARLTIFSRLAQASGASSALSLAALSSSAFRCALSAT